MHRQLTWELYQIILPQNGTIGVHPRLEILLLAELIQRVCLVNGPVDKSGSMESPY